MAAAAKSSSNGNNGHVVVADQLQVAPFVVKTYQMVNDPRTDSLIRWGRQNNSFLVLDPADFSLLLLPAYFKHSNFSSFVRQLNTYGFKKVDSDRWEFAHESFLRGQTHLLPLIMRRKKRVDDDQGDKKPYAVEEEEEEEDEDGETLLKEVGRLREEQRALEQELEGMSKRLQMTERRPHQMISFLVKVAEDPDLLPRLIVSKKQQLADDREKRRRLSVSESSSDNHSLPPLPQSFERNHPLQPAALAFGEAIDAGGGGGDGRIGPEDQVVLLPEFGASEANEVAYPFSLLGRVFF